MKNVKSWFVAAFIVAVMFFGCSSQVKKPEKGMEPPEGVQESVVQKGQEIILSQGNLARMTTIETTWGDSGDVNKTDARLSINGRIVNKIEADDWQWNRYRAVYQRTPATVTAFHTGYSPYGDGDITFEVWDIKSNKLFKKKSFKGHLLDFHRYQNRVALVTEYDGVKVVNLTTLTSTVFKPKVPKGFEHVGIYKSGLNGPLLWLSGAEFRPCSWREVYSMDDEFSRPWSVAINMDEM